MDGDRYDYRDAESRYLFSVVVEREGGSKKVRQGVRHEDGSWTWSLNGIEPPLYRLPEVCDHLVANQADPLWIVEGEKDADRLRSLGLTATTNPMGAGKWRPWHTDALRGVRRVVIVADADKPGRNHARQVHSALAEVGVEADLVQPPADLGEHADVSDLLDAGLDLTALVPLDPVATDTAPVVAEQWLPVPLAEAAANAAPAMPEHGRGLVYGSGALTLVSGEPGVGKSMVLAALVADEAQAGRTALYLDFERTPDLLHSRLTDSGLDAQALARILYLRPHSPATPAEIVAMVERLRPELVVLDSYDAALELFGLETKNEDVRKFAARVLDPLRSTGAPLVAADHVAKNPEQRRRYSIGGQAKLAHAEAHLGLTVIDPLRRGAEGRLKVRALKDTFGRLPHAATFTLRSHELTGALSWRVGPVSEDADEGEGFRPTGYMEKVSRRLERSPEPLSRAALERDVKGKRDYIRLALDTLVNEGYADEQAGERGARLVSLVRPFREGGS